MACVGRGDDVPWSGTSYTLVSVVWFLDRNQVHLSKSVLPVNDELRRPGLGRHLVGQRVVVRRVLPGETGPSGGPAMTDLLGVMESWAGGVTTVRSASGQVTVIAVADIVSGKPVPPRASVHQQVTAQQAERHAVVGWAPLICQPLGEWLLRASDGYSTRANSVLAVGDPGISITSATDAVRDFYAEHALPPLAQVVVDSPEHRTLESAGWISARPGEADTAFQIASLSQVMRATRRLRQSVVPDVSLSTTVSPAWLAADDRRAWTGPAAVKVLEGPVHVCFGCVYATPSEGDEHLIAKGRAAYDADWVGVTNLWVSPDHRRRGLGVAVLEKLLGWGAELGARTTYLQTRGDNLAALALYERLGFTTHHTYRYLAPN